jgi:hypothetical protein
MMKLKEKFGEVNENFEVEKAKREMDSNIWPSGREMAYETIRDSEEEVLFEC